MFKRLWEKFLDYILTQRGIEIDFGHTRLFIGIVLGFILTTAIFVAHVG